MNSVQVPGGFAAVVVLVPKSPEAAARQEQGQVPPVQIVGLSAVEKSMEHEFVKEAIIFLVEDQAGLIDQLFEDLDQGAESDPAAATTSGNGAGTAHAAEEAAEETEEEEEEGEEGEEPGDEPTTDK